MRFDGKILLALVLPWSLHAAVYTVVSGNDRVDGCEEREILCREGVDYLEGRIGAERILKEIPDCPYERCGKKPAKGHVDGRNGKKMLVLMRPDYRKAMAYLLESSFGEGSRYAARRALAFLLGRIDYKSATPSDYLIRRLERETGIDFERYRLLVKNLIETLCREGDTYGLARKREFVEGGYLSLYRPDEAFGKKE